MDEHTSIERSQQENDEGAVIHDRPGARAPDARPPVAAPPEDRAAKIQALKVAIADGKYRPDPEQIARKLMERGFQ